MSDEVRADEKTFEMSMMPFYNSMGLGRELGSLDSRMARVENDIQHLDAKIDVVEARLTARINALDTKIDAVDARVDKCHVAISRMDERIQAMDEKFTAAINSNRTLMLSVLAAVIAGIILQFFFK